MNITANVVFSISAFTAVVSLFAAGPLVATQQAHAQWWDGGYGDYGGYYDPGSPPPYAYCSYADYKSNVVSYGYCYPFDY